MFFNMSRRDLLPGVKENLVGLVSALGPAIAGEVLLRIRCGLEFEDALETVSDGLGSGGGSGFNPEECLDRGCLEIQVTVLGCRVSWPETSCLKEGPVSIAKKEVGRKG